MNWRKYDGRLRNTRERKLTVDSSRFTVEYNKKFKIKKLRELRGENNLDGITRLKGLRIGAGFSFPVET